jgi:hypothetical protein
MSGLFSVVGTPSPKLYAVLNIVRALVQVTIGEPVVIVANSLEELRKEFPDGPTRKNRAVVLVSDYPQPDIWAAFAHLKAPVVISIDDFATVALFSVVSRGFGAVAAARFATMGLINVAPAVVSPPPFSLFAGDPKVETLAGLILKLGAFYKIQMKDDTLAKVLAFLGVAELGGAVLCEYIDRKVAAIGKMAEDARVSLESRSPLECELIDFLAPQYDAVAQGRPLERLEWPVYALLRPEFPDRMTIGPIDLTGPARFIYHGPYFALPAGAWWADISLEVRDCYSDNHIALDVCAMGELLAVVRTKLPPSGVYGCQIRFEIEDPSKAVEIRMTLLTGAIEGVIRLHAIALHRLSSLDEPEFGEAVEEEPSAGTR